MANLMSWYHIVKSLWILLHQEIEVVTVIARSFLSHVQIICTSEITNTSTQHSVLWPTLYVCWCCLMHSWGIWHDNPLTRGWSIHVCAGGSANPQNDNRRPCLSCCRGTCPERASIFCHWLGYCSHLQASLEDVPLCKVSFLRQRPRKEVCFQASTQPLAHNLLLRRLVVTMFSVLEAC